MGRYILKGTGNKLIQWHSVVICGRSPEMESGYLYWDQTEERWIVFTTGASDLFLENERICGPVDIDIYAIAHRFVDKATASRLADAIEAELALKLAEESDRNE